MWMDCLVRCCLLLPLVPVGSGDVAGFPANDDAHVAVDQPASIAEVDFVRAFAEAKPWDRQQSERAIQTICEIRKEVGLGTFCAFGCESAECESSSPAFVSHELVSHGVCPASCEKDCKECCVGTCVGQCTTTCAVTGSQDKSSCDCSGSCCGVQSTTVLSHSDQEFEQLLLTEFGLSAEELPPYEATPLGNVHVCPSPSMELSLSRTDPSGSPVVLRKAGRELDQVANDLEDQGVYGTADQLRQISQLLRQQARQVR